MRDLLNNLVAGFRLASFLRVQASDFRVSIAQLVWLVLIEFALTVGMGYARLEGGGFFNPGIIMQSLASLSIALGVAALLARWLRVPSLLPAYVVATTAISPPVFAYAYAGYALWQRAVPDPALAWVWSLVVLLWLATLMTRAVRLWAPLGIGKRLGVILLQVAVLATQFWVLPRQEAWYPRYADDTDEALQIGTHEALLYQQASLLDHSLHALEKQRPGIRDLYFIGFASYGWQDVFMKEVDTVRALFDRRFGTRGRSLVLVNNPASVTKQPLATVTALEDALKQVGALMDPEEDMLFLFLTSHGSGKPPFLSIDQDGLKLTQLTPQRLKSALAATPIKWKVIVVSACYSGSFIPALSDDNTVVITASRADRNSFGCASKYDMTDFGRAYFAEALNQTTSFTEAFELARKRIAVREAREGLTPSQPQMVVGQSFAAHWQAHPPGSRI